MKSLSQLSREELGALSAEELLSQVSVEAAAHLHGGPDLEKYHVSISRSPEMRATFRRTWEKIKAQLKSSEVTLAPQIDAGLSVSGTPSWVRIGRGAKTIEAKAVEVAPIKEETKPKSLAVVAPEAKKQALIKFNPIKNPYGLNGFENARIALEQMELDCALDLFHQKPIIQGRYTWLGGEGFEDIDNVILKLRELILDEFGFDPKAGTFDSFRTRCVNNAFDPLLDYLDSLEWDRKLRLDRWLVDYARADDTPLNRAIGRKVLIAAVRRARKPGCKFDYIVVLEGDQGIGKSTLVATLAGEGFYSDKPIIGCDTREQQESIQGVWLYEIAELEGLSKVDLSWMKGFASRTHDKARPAFGRSVVNRPRRNILIGTTNDTHYLRDTTGNRRWWPVKLHGRIDLSGLVRDRDQLWAEAVAAEATDEPLVISESLWGAVAIEQQARMEIDAWLEPISDHLAKLETKRANLEGCFSSKDADKNCVPEFRVSSAYLLGNVLSISESRRGQRDTKRLADVMRTLGWQLAQYPIKVGKKTCRAYAKPQPTE